VKSPNALDVSPSTTTVTTAYASGWVTSWIDPGLAWFARMLLFVTKADATTIELLLEVEDVDGTDGYETWRISSGAASKDEVTLTAADLGTTHRIALQVDVSDVRRLRLRAKKTGGSGTVTLTAGVVTGAHS